MLSKIIGHTILGGFMALFCGFHFAIIFVAACALLSHLGFDEDEEDCE